MESETIDRDLLAWGAPVQRGWQAEDLPESGCLVGVWDRAVFDDRSGVHGFDELMLLLENSVEMAMPDDTKVTVSTGKNS